MIIDPFWMLKYWLFLTNARWYQGIFRDLVEREIADLLGEYFWNIFEPADF